MMKGIEIAYNEIINNERMNNMFNELLEMASNLNLFMTYNDVKEPVKLKIIYTINSSNKMDMETKNWLLEEWQINKSLKLYEIILGIMRYGEHDYTGKNPDAELWLQEAMDTDLFGLEELDDIPCSYCEYIHLCKNFDYNKCNMGI